MLPKDPVILLSGVNGKLLGTAKLLWSPAAFC